MRTLVPAPPQVFVGRSRELASFAAASSSIRLFLVYGVAGIGKTSFMLRATDALTDRFGAVAHVRCQTSDTVTTIAGEALAQLPGRGDAAVANDLDRLIDYVRTTPVMLCVDDAHRLAETVIQDLVTLAGAQLPLRLCLASREALPVSPHAIDHSIVQIGRAHV